MANAPELDAVLEAIGVAVVVFDGDGVLRHANDLAGRWLARSREELVGRSYEEWGSLLQEAFSTTGASEPVPADPTLEQTERLETSGYPRRVYERESRPIRGPQGEVVGRLELLRNVSDLVRKEEERARLEAAHAREIGVLEGHLEQSQKFQMELTANVSHDLRTPLASIKASISALLAGDVAYDPQTLRETLSVVDEETDRLQRRVQNLLSMARMEAGDATLNKDWLDVADMVASSVESMRSIRGGRPLKLEFADDLPMVQGDYDMLQIACRNLIENAFLYSPPDSPVEVSVTGGLGQVRVRVRDFGPGLMPDEFERVFDKFYRGRVARRIPGTGLGLPICRGIAEAHGGRLWAEHVPGGVAFVLSLPVPDAPPELPQRNEE